MLNFNIRASAESAEIDIFGTIGEDWFSEGFTMQRCREDLAAITSPNVTMNVSSLGGDVNHALVIHDLIKSHPSKFTAKIMGATASAGTIVALAADQVEMSKNALFLVHNAWTFALGNAEELRKTAGDLDQFDNRIVSIYKKKTGKRENTIRNLMAEEKWIDANEAQDFGFVDKVYEPTKAAASMVRNQYEEIKADGRLPKLPENINHIINNEMTLKDEIQTMFDGFKTEVKGWFSKPDEGEEPKAVTEDQVNAKIEEIENKLKDLEVSNSQELAEKVTEIEALTAAKDAAEANVTDLTAKLTSAQAKLDAIEASASGKDATIDPTPDGKTSKPTNPFDAAAASMKDEYKDF